MAPEQFSVFFCNFVQLWQPNSSVTHSDFCSSFICAVGPPLNPSRGIIVMDHCLLFRHLRFDFFWQYSGVRCPLLDKWSVHAYLTIFISKIIRSFLGETQSAQFKEAATAPLLPSLFLPPKRGFCQLHWNCSAIRMALWEALLISVMAWRESFLVPHSSKV